MTRPDLSSTPRTTRREFLKTSGTALTGAALAATVVHPRPGYAAEDNTIKVALVGCGGRGTGAAGNALLTEGPVKLVALADVFPDRVANSFKILSEQFPGRVEVPPERRFTGFDAYRRVIDCLGGSDVVVLATPCCFRPIHVEYAVDRGVNVCMEKSFAVDAPGVRRVLKAGEEATRKNLKIASGLMWRHDPAREEVIRRLHDGAIGDLIIHVRRRNHSPGPGTAHHRLLWHLLRLCSRDERIGSDHGKPRCCSS